MKKNIGLFDKNVYVTGHSKGGNLAMSSVMNLGNFKFNKINKIINFDGPGFRKNEYISDKYKKMSNKLINIVPSSSYIGVLMFNKDYNVIKTSAHAINVHYPIFWNISGTEFVSANLSKLSNELHVRTSQNIENINDESMKYFFEESFKAIENKRTSSIKFSFKDMINVFKKVKGIDKETFDYVYSVLKSIIKISNKEVKNEK